MGDYPNRFIDNSGYEWRKGPYILKEDGITLYYTWKFRPTEKTKDFGQMEIYEKVWDYATQLQLDAWDISIVETLSK